MIKLFLPLILIFGIIGGVYLVQNRVNLFPRADEKPFREKITISNIAPTSLAISYFTKAASNDFIRYGEDTSLPETALDSRNQNGLNPRLLTHYFLLKNLKPDTKYYFKISSNGVLLPHNEYLSAQTAKTISGSPGVEIFSGTVRKFEPKTAPAEGIVFLISEKGQLLSAPMKENGDWTVAFSGMRKEDLSEYLELSDTDLIKFMAYAGSGGFGLFGEFALKKSGINIETDKGRIPFYKIETTLPDNSSDSQNGEDNILW